MGKKQKIIELKKLGDYRQSKCYAGYKNIADFHEGGYESRFVSPYTNTAGNVDSPIMILLQDWASEKKLLEPFSQEGARLGYAPSLQTNKNLSQLLQNTFGLILPDVFVTNVFPFIKPGKMNAPVPQRDINAAFKEFCLPQINIVNPSLVICCGKKVFLSVMNYFGDSSNPKVHDSIQNGRAVYYYQRHPSPQAVNRNGGMDQAKSDWIKMKNNCNLPPKKH